MSGKKYIIPCTQAVKKMFELLEGKIELSERDKLDVHLDTCRECCNRLEFESLLRKKLQTVNQEEKVPTSLEKKISGLLKTF